MHRTIAGWTLGLVLGLCGSVAGARTVVECADAEGNTSFRNQCPPDMKKIGEYKLVGVKPKAGPTLDDIAKGAPIVFYSVPECDACDLVRNRLKARGLPFTETDVQDNAEAQTAMRAATGGLTVPSVMIGEKVLSGYSSEALNAALTEAGYPDTPAEGAPAAGPTTSTAAAD